MVKVYAETLKSFEHSDMNVDSLEKRAYGIYVEAAPSCGSGAKRFTFDIASDLLFDPYDKNEQNLIF